MTLSERSPALDDPSVDPARGRRRVPLWLAIVACSVPMFMVALDNLVVSTALRTLAVDLEASTQQLQWFVNAYVLSFACLLMTGAALGDRFGRRMGVRDRHRRLHPGLHAAADWPTAARS